MEKTARVARGLRLMPEVWAAIEREATEIDRHPLEYLRMRVEALYGVGRGVKATDRS